MIKQKVLTLLVLLMTAVTGAWAQIEADIENEPFGTPARMYLPTYKASLALGEKMVLSAYVNGVAETNKIVVWTVGGTEGAVGLYTDEDCENPVGTDPTTNFTVYAKRLQKGEATVTVTLTSDETKTATCVFTVSPAGYSVALKDVTADAAKWEGKAGTGGYQPLPLTGVEENTTVSVKYSGTNIVKSVKAVKKVAPAGILNGLFSVSENQQVRFSQGNLRATTTDKGITWTWSFATKQYDFVGKVAANTAINDNSSVTENGAVDLFGWSTATTVYGISDARDQGNYGGDFIDWGYAIAKGGHFGWRTLTNDEWGYLFNTRANAANKCGHGKVNDVKGLILLPDEWTLPSGLTFTPGCSSGYDTNVYTLDQWAQMEKGGAVFLPAAGFRDYRSVNTGSGYYWSSTASSASNANHLKFQTTTVNPQTVLGRQYGASVRLVKDN